MILIIDFWEKWRPFGKRFQTKGLSIAHSPYYIVYKGIKMLPSKNK